MIDYSEHVFKPRESDKPDEISAEELHLNAVFDTIGPEEFAIFSARSTMIFQDLQMELNQILLRSDIPTAHKLKKIIEYQEQGAKEFKSYLHFKRLNKE